MTMFTVIAARAKINLNLKITAKRADGYHDLQSRVVFADCADIIRATRNADKKDRIETTGEFAKFLHPDNNLIAKTLAALRQISPDLPYVDIQLQKNIPIGAGLGGGSADAAAIIRWAMECDGGLIQKTASGEFSPLAFGKSIGADVPVCISSRPCVMRGVGDIIEYWPDAPQLHGVLLFPQIAIATKDIFIQWTNSKKSARAANEYQNDNDLFEPACAAHPQLRGIADKIADLRADFWGMTGSGSCFYALSPIAKNAAHWAAQLQKHYPDFWIKPIKTGI